MGTQTFPAAVTALGKESVIYLPAAAALAAVTVAEATATGTIHLTCAIRQFNANAEQASSRKYRLCSIQSFERPGRVDWTIDPITFIDDPQALDSSTTYPHRSLVPGTIGWILRRRGLSSEPGAFTAIAAAQRYDIFTVEWGVRVPVPVNPEEEGQEFEYTQRPFVTGTRIEGAIAA